MSDHGKKLQSTIRKNNIFGEREDHIIKGFLAIGGEAAFYSPQDGALLFGRSAKSVYLALIKRIGNASENADPSDEERRAITVAATTIGAIPLFGVDRTYCRSAKWFDLDGKKVSSL